MTKKELEIEIKFITLQIENLQLRREIMTRDYTAMPEDEDATIE